MHAGIIKNMTKSHNFFVLRSSRSHCCKILVETELQLFRVRTGQYWVQVFYEYQILCRIFMDVLVRLLRRSLGSTGLRVFSYTKIVLLLSIRV